MSARPPASVLALAVAALAGCTAAGDGRTAAAPLPAPEIVNTTAPCPDQPAAAADGEQVLPALAFPCLGGGELDLGRAPGVPTVVNLWASWCGPCREELPVLQEYADTAGDRVRVVGVVSRDGEPQATSFAADAGVSFPSAFDAEGRLMTGLGLNGLPYTAFLNADGALVHAEFGPVDSVAELEELAAEHLGVAG